MPDIATSVVAAAEEPPFSFETPREAPRALRCHHTVYSGRVRRRCRGTRSLLVPGSTNRDHTSPASTAT